MLSYPCIKQGSASAFKAITAATTVQGTLYDILLPARLRFKVMQMRFPGGTLFVYI